MAKREEHAARDALTALKVGKWQTGPGWERAHEICQAREGQTVFDRIHALCHRIEGDLGNAAYWYRRAGVPVENGDFATEAEKIRRDL